MSTHKLTDKLLSATSVEVWDSLVKGLHLRVGSSSKTFFVRYRVSRRQPRYKLGAYPVLSLADARRDAKKVLRDVAQGRDPQAERRAQRTAETFRELSTEYLEKHAKPKKRSWREDERALNKDLLPLWGSRTATQISRRDVILLLDRIVERGAPVQANRTLALVSKIFNFGIGRGIVEANPAHRVERPAKETPRQRTLKNEEIVSLWAALQDFDPVVAASYRLRLLTAQRGQEVRSMRWQDIDGDWWTIPATVSKNGLEHRVPLSRMALEALEELKPITGDSDWVLESPRLPGRHIGGLPTANQRLRETSGVDFTPHDLRRTAATRIVGGGHADRTVVKKILNHVDTGVTAVYDLHSYGPEKRRALDWWDRELARILGIDRSAANVLRMA